MIRFSDLIGKTVKVIEVENAEYNEGNEYSQGVVIELNGVRYTLKAEVCGYDDEAEIRLDENNDLN